MKKILFCIIICFSLCAAGVAQDAVVEEEIVVQEEEVVPSEDIGVPELVEGQEEGISDEDISDEGISDEGIGPQAFRKKRHGNR